ncbi:succinylglutamate desuccinylase/aspartoacylase domain-containing protein [Fodinibius halophilus]|uniref:Succinylglutamate desuccinylase/aspartoacylase family protein n=1 Tax=Fodinibius halophilus TaxID=1736908 RepID=A0A6M1TMD6_9BACT|nr:succinylglutamate desuccinylase/aspartoacylase family protein [Fodinibius halophilus]NGP89560.1 succinylglutamate desuccinylase/aspartoacylase family protein [Fodinibius halophilus]
MNNSSVAKVKTEDINKRIIGAVEGDPDGPTVVVLAGMHGNERAGVEAVKNVIGTLHGIEPPIDGHLLGLRANISALEQNMRYIDEDMNRIWFPSVISEVRETPEKELGSSERVEMKRLLRILDNIENRTNGPVILADVHTFSADGWMFTITSSDPKQRKLLSKLHVPMVFGIEESLLGTALGYYQKQGFVSFGLEGGQHRHQLTEYNTTASLMLLLQAVGCIEQQYVDQIKKYEKHMRSHTKYLPVETELVYQHIIESGDEFRMQPGYKNFQPVKKGEWLASDKEGKIVARCDGYILMPLYQSQGNDGFFIIKEHES